MMKMVQIFPGTSTTMNPHFQKFGAWLVNLFTASGAVAAFYAVVCISKNDLVSAMWLLFLCLFIDGIDGTFARIFKASEALPWIDGKTIDEVVDFLTYAFVPTYMMYQAGIFADSIMPVAVSLILLTSAFYYGKKGMVSLDLHFVGFPVLWNLLAFYLVFLSRENHTFNFLVISFFSVLHFIPLKFAYPSRSTVLFYPTLIVAVINLASCSGILYFYPHMPQWLVILSLATVGYFGVLAIWVTYLMSTPKESSNNLAE